MVLTGNKCISGIATLENIDKAINDALSQIPNTFIVDIIITPLQLTREQLTYYELSPNQAYFLVTIIYKEIETKKSEEK
jgi:hypothetical protein